MVENIGNGLDDALNQWVKNLTKKTAGMSLADKTDISLAGAQVFEKRLKETTKTKHYSGHNDKKFGHAADHIGLYQTKTGSSSDINTSSGSFIVGWKNHYHAMNMMRLNDGTTNVTPDHFITNLRHDSQVRNEILQAEKKKYQELLNKGDES